MQPAVQGVVKLKDMASGQEEEVPRAQVVQAVQQRAAGMQQPEKGLVLAKFTDSQYDPSVPAGNRRRAACNP